MPNKRPVGSERTFTNGYTYVKYASGKWKLKSRYVVEQALGIELHPNVTVWFKDGNKQNFDLSNLTIFDKHNKMKIYFDQAQPIGEGMFSWSRKYKQCRGCNSKKEKHHGLGLCETCYKSLQ